LVFSSTGSTTGDGEEEKDATADGVPNNSFVDAVTVAVAWTTGTTAVICSHGRSVLTASYRAKW